jgi:purine-nucleoside/S-methyl-5'-thioadenosine phosphorylase / adenosine deaminase
MLFHQAGLIHYYTFESLAGVGITHAVITRRGGISPAPWASLNVGGTVGDEAERVLENRKRSFNALGRSLESLYDVWQVHGTEVVCVQAPRAPGSPHLKADAILTDRIGVTLFMRFADCVPIFLFDPVKRVIGLVHAGWLGTVQFTARRAVQAMHAHYGTRPQDILAGIGPSIGPHHYPVGLEVVQRARQAFGSEASRLLIHPKEGDSETEVQFDLWSANSLVLQQAGVHMIEVSGICTVCDPESWYTHRGEKGRTGRFGALVAL